MFTLHFRRTQEGLDFGRIVTNSEHTQEFAKELGLLETCSVAIGAMIGGGIFSVLGYLATNAGPAGVLAFVIGGSIALLTAHSYIRLSLEYPSSGGEFVFLRRAYSTPLIGDTIGSLLWLGYSVTVALYAVTFGLYASEAMYVITGFDSFANDGGGVKSLGALGEFITFGRLMAFFVIALFMGVNLKGVKETGLIQNVIVLFKLGVLLFVAVAGLFFVKKERYQPFMPNGWTPIIVGGAIIFVSYEGFQVISNTIEEMQRPEKDIRRGMYLSIGIVALTYIAVATVAIGLVSGEVSDAALIDAVAFLGVFGVILITAGAIASTSSAINATLLGSSRLAYTMSDWQAFPKRFAAVSERTKVPYMSIIITSSISFMFTFFGNGEAIAEVGSIVFLLVFLVINLTAWRSFPLARNLTAKFGVVAILFYLGVLFHHLFTDGSVFSMVVLASFLALIFSWQAINARSNRGLDIKLPTIPAPLTIAAREVPVFAERLPDTDAFFLGLDTILLPLSGKKHERTAVAFAASLARSYNARVTLLHVGGPTNGLDWCINKLEEFQVKYDLILKKSFRVAETILKTYRSGDFQLVVMPAQRKDSMFSRLFQTSISAQVVKSVNCAVLQIMPPKLGSLTGDIRDIFTLLDGSRRDGYLTRWANIIASVGAQSTVFAYHVILLPQTLPLDGLSDHPSVLVSQHNFEVYATMLGERVGIDSQPRLLFGHNFVKAVASSTHVRKPDAILIGRTKDKGIRGFHRAPLSSRLLHEVDCAVLVHHMPENGNAVQNVE